MLKEQLNYKSIRADRESRLENQAREAEHARRFWKDLSKRELVCQMRNTRREELRKEYMSRA